MLTPLRNQRGQAMAAMGIGLMAFLGLTVVAVDIGHMAFTATEVQTAADAAATAGATALLQGLGAGLEEDLAKAQAQLDGTNVARANPVNGAAPDAPVGSSIVIESGNWDGSGFSGGTPLNAVQATITTTVPNIVAAMWNPTSTVRKVAVAAFTSVGTATPQLPFVFGDCLFDQPPDCAHPHAPVTIFLGSQLDFGAVSPDPSNPKNINLGWTTYGTTLTITPAGVQNLLPEVCGGGGGTMPPLTVNQPPFSILEGSPLNFNGAVSVLQNCVSVNPAGTDPPQSQPFLVPMFGCQDTSTSSTQAVGFGTIVLSNPQVSNQGVPRIDVQQICNVSQPSSPGGNNLGTGFIALVN